jgi:hypothetical protein
VNIHQTVADSLDATARSKQLSARACQLEQKAREAIKIRAQHLAEQLPRNITGDKVVADWIDDRDRRHKIVVASSRNIFSYAYFPGQPNGRINTNHRLDRTALKHLAQHFGPLMSANYEMLAFQ